MGPARQCLIGEQLVPEAGARVALLDRGFLYGDGLFETLRSYGGRPFQLEKHWERLTASAAFLGIPVPHSDPRRLVNRVLEANAATDAVVRFTLTRGTVPAGPRPGRDAAQPTLVTQCRPLRADLAEAALRGVRGARLPWPLRAAGLPLQQHKTLSYLASVLALGAVDDGVEPLLENTGGEVVEGALSNLFWAHAGRLHTPGLESGCLPGIARATVLDLAPRAGLTVQEGCFPFADLLAADEAFLTNAAVEVLPLVQVGARPLGAGCPGPLTRSLQQAYREAVRAELGGP